MREISYNTWKRKDWKQYFLSVLESNSLEKTGEVLWSAWNSPENPNKDRFNNIESLLFNLYTYKEKTAINTVPTITADSVPVYNTWSNWWNDSESVWNCNHWIEWYEKNALAYGANSTKYKFINYWSSPDNFSVGVFGDGMGYTCGRDCDFINYFRVKGIDVTVFGATTVCNLVAIPSNLLDATANLSQTVSNTTRVMSNIVPLAFVAFTAMFFISKSK